jgi:hypothetical protein
MAKACVGNTASIEKAIKKAITNATDFFKVSFSFLCDYLNGLLYVSLKAL